MFRFAALIVAAFAAAANAGTWKEVGTLADIGLGFEFVSPTVGYTVGAYNGEEGQWLLSTTNGGANWTSIEVTPNFGIALCLAVEKESIFVNSLFGAYISPDAGKTWKNVTGLHAQGQGCRVQDGEFFVVGTGLLWGNGVLHSKDGDVFEGHNITNLPGGMLPQFGAFPSSSTWYVTAGSFPQSDDDNAPTQDDDPPSYDRILKSVGEHGFYSGAIIKSADGGKTFHTQISEQNEFDFNMVDCADEDHCCAVAINAEDAFVYCTSDGSTWENVYNATSSQLTTITALDGQWVAAGMVIDGQAIRASVLRSTDMKTWVEDELTTLPQCAVIDASFPTIDSGFILGIDRFNSLIVYSYSA